MSKSDIIVGIDIGSSNVRTVIVQNFPEEELPRIIGVGVVPSQGLRRGVIVDIDEAVKSINSSMLNSLL